MARLLRKIEIQINVGYVKTIGQNVIFQPTRQSLIINEGVFKG